MNFEHEPGMDVLETARLRLRHFIADDAAFVLELLNDPAFLQNIGDKKVRTLAEARGYLLQGPMASYAEHGFGLNLVVLRESGAPIGMCGLLKRPNLQDVDIGYAFLPHFTGKGYATESAAAVLAHGREQFGLQRIVAIVSPHNRASIRVLEKLGLVFERSIQLSGDANPVSLFAPPA